MIEEVAQALGYRPEDDSWDTDGRRTYIHDESANLQSFRDLVALLAPLGWFRDSHSLRTLRHESGEIVEVEPGGPGTSGHYLHHMRAAVIA